MGIAAGGMIKQVIKKDDISADRWNKERTMKIPVHILNSAAFRHVTGRDPPPSPIDATTYADAGLPFFKMYEEPSGITGDFATVKSVNEINQDRGIAGGEETPVNPSLIYLNSRGERCLPNLPIYSDIESEDTKS